MAGISDIRAGLPVNPIKPDREVGSRKKREDGKRKDKNDEEHGKDEDPGSATHIDEYA